MTQPEALRLANALEAEDWDWSEVPKASAELRRLYADNEKKSEAIQRLWKERDELRVQRDALLEALEEAKLHIWLGDEKGVAANIKCHQIIDAIAKAEGKT